MNLYWEKTASWYWFAGGFCLNIYMLAGNWVSAGLHLSIVPLYIDLHVLWFVVSLMSRARGEMIHEAELAYKEG
jgi:hypothetical protein